MDRLHGWRSRMLGLSESFTVLGALLVLCCVSGCTYTAAGTISPPVEPPPGSLFRPRIEYTVGDFGFSRGGADLVRSTVDGTLLSSEILDAWNQRGYAVAAHFVEEAAFSGKAEYHLTLSGSQRNSASFFAELLNVLTVFVVPYTVRQEYDLTYVLDDMKCGKTYSANVKGADMTYLGLLVIPGLPFAQGGHRTTVQQMGDSLYEQFWRQGAFEWPCPAPTPVPLS